MMQDFDLDVDVAACFQWDWMHCLLVDGTVERELNACLEALEPFQLGTATLRVCLRG